MNRRERRTARSKDGLTFPVAVPPDASDSVRAIIGDLLGFMARFPSKGKRPEDAASAAEQKALALIVTAGYELAQMPDTPHRQAIISQGAEFLTWMVAENEQAVDDLARLDERAALELARVEAEDGGSDETPLVEMAPKPGDVSIGRMFYLSAVKGIDDPAGQKDRVYYGKVYRVPRDMIGSDRQLQFETSEMLDLQARFINAAVAEDRASAFGEPVERYEIFDPESGDVLVMYRVPYRRLDEADTAGTA